VLVGVQDAGEEGPLDVGLGRVQLAQGPASVQHDDPIGHPRDLIPEAARAGAKPDVANFVLKPPRREEQEVIDASIERALAVMPFVMGGEIERAMMNLHRAS